MAVEIRLVGTKKERKEFIKFPWNIYSEDPELRKTGFLRSLWIT